jgi:hypothetical protein
VRGRSRTIKPEIFDDEVLADLELKTGLPLFRVFAGLWCFADREGRFEWAPRSLRGSIHPCWDGDMGAALEALASRSYIVRYTVSGRDYGYIRSFKRHQHVHQKEQQSLLPDPSEHGSAELPVIPGKDPPGRMGVPGTSTSTSTSNSTFNSAAGAAAPSVPPSETLVSVVPLTLDEPTPKTETRKRKSALPADFAPNGTALNLARELRVDLKTELQQFIDHHNSKATVSADWQAHLRTWIRNAAKWAPARGGRREQPNQPNAGVTGLEKVIEFK